MEIINSRVFKATAEDLFDAVANPDILAQWWGPEGFTNTFDKFHFGPAGDWHFTMSAPDGTGYYNESRFIEIVRPSRIVLEHLRPMHYYRMTMSFEKEATGDTRMTWQMIFDDNEDNLKIRDFIAHANEQNFDRLAACLAK